VILAFGREDPYHRALRGAPEEAWTGSPLGSGGSSIQGRHMPLIVVTPTPTATPKLPRAALALCALLSLAGGCASGRGSGAPANQTTVTAKDIDQNPGTPIEQILEAKVPGIAVSRMADGSVSIEIRGSSSFYSGTTPLYVLDGVPIQAGRGGALAGVNPYDIETIKVLKNPAETAIYGVRGANGVLLITTKRPVKLNP
jgi:TonB-dependent SusC/RagA subfamily outer membrane receptor